MACEHLRQLYQLCLDQQLRLGTSDLIRVVCKQCNQTETCPSNLIDEDADATSDGACESAQSVPSRSPNEG